MNNFYREDKSHAVK